jgi:hypothetical protein
MLVGFIFVSLSGTWINASAAGPEALSKIWIYGGIMYLAAVVFIYLSKEVRVKFE